MRILVDSEKNTFTVTSKEYSLNFDIKNPSFVRLTAGGYSQKLCIWSSSDASHEKDVISEVNLKPEVKKIKGGQRIIFKGAGTLHGKKSYIFDCYEDYIEYYYKFKPGAALDKLHYFYGWGTSSLFSGKKKGGKKKAQAERMDIKELKSSKAFTHLFNPEPNGLDRQWVSAQDYAKVSVNNDPNFNGSNWFFTPGVLAFAVTDRNKKKWINFGIACKNGEYNFNDYEYMGGRFMGLTLTYHGQTFPKKQFETPRLLIQFGPSEGEVIEEYIEWLIKKKYVARNKRKQASWWKKPIFCGWGQQCAESDFYKLKGEKDRPLEWNPHQYANQAYYEFMLDVLDRNKIPYGSIVLDDKWQRERGLPQADRGKWPDLRAFVDRMHKKGKKVILWWGLFTGEGVPEEMCIRKGEEKICEDPTNPEFLKVMRKAVKKMLSDKPGCYNADGFKIDFTANIPFCEECERYGDAWGIEMLRQYIQEIYLAAKRAKKDSFIITHTANPYFMNCCDAIRLNDICEHYQDSILNKMEFRSEMAELACPGLLIDTDNWPCPSRKSWLDYMQVQPSMGVPSLYYATHIDASGEAIREKDWEIVSEIWHEYIDNLK